jgi:hypothetical protein
MNKIITIVSILLTIVALAVVALTAGCSKKASEQKNVNFILNFERDPQLDVPLDVRVNKASDKWWFYDNFSFVTRVSNIGNILMVAEIGRCLDPDADQKVTKTFNMRFFDGLRWNEVGSYSEPDVITEMKMISGNPQMSFVWAEAHSRGSIQYQAVGAQRVIMDFQNLLPLYGYSEGDRIKRSYDYGEGRLQIGDSVWMGFMFHEMINVKGNNKCIDDMPDFVRKNSFRLFGQTSAGKTIIASVDLNNDEYTAHRSFFAILDLERNQVAEGAPLLTNGNADFKPVPHYEDGLLPHFVQIDSGDKIGVRADLWIDKDRYDPLPDGSVRTGVWGNAVYWNHREKLWGVLDHYQTPKADTTFLMGTMQ